MSTQALSLTTIQGTERPFQFQEHALKDLFSQSNVLISRHIKQHLPDNSYSYIFVSTIKYRFSDRASQPIDTKLISLTLATQTKISAFFWGLLAGIGFLSPSAFDQQVKPAKLEMQLLQTIAGDEHEQDQIKLAFDQARTIHLYIAKDLTFSELEVETSAANIANGIGKTIKIGLNALVLFSQVMTAAKSIQNTLTVKR